MEEWTSERHQAFTGLYKEYYPAICNFFRKKVQDKCEAEDLAMEVFSKCWEKYDTFDECKGSFESWLFTIAGNRAKNYYRDNKKKTVPLDTLFFSADNTAPSFEEEITQAEYIAFLRDRLADALSTLPERQSKIIILRYFYRKSCNETAELIGETPGNTRVLLSRAMAKIREYFAENSTADCR